MQTCHADCAAYLYFLTCLELVHQHSDNIKAHIVVRRFLFYMLVRLILSSHDKYFLTFWSFNVDFDVDFSIDFDVNFSVYFDMLFNIQQALEAYKN